MVSYFPAAATPKRSLIIHRDVSPFHNWDDDSHILLQSFEKLRAIAADGMFIYFGPNPHSLTQSNGAVCLIPLLIDLKCALCALPSTERCIHFRGRNLLRCESNKFLRSMDRPPLQGHSDMTSAPGGGGGSQNMMTVLEVAWMGQWQEGEGVQNF